MGRKEYVGQECVVWNRGLCGREGGFACEINVHSVASVC